MRRVVVTGMGMVTPLGSDPATVFTDVIAGKSGVRHVHDFDTIGDMGARIAAPVRDFEPERIARKHRRSMARMAQYAATAAGEALRRAEFPQERLDTGRVAVVAGSTTGSPDAMEEFWREFLATNSIRGIPSTSFLRVMSHTVAAHIALAYGVTGSVLSPSCACAASNQAIGLGLDLIRLGRADAVIAGGADELNVLSAATFDIVRAACRGHEDAPHTRPAPFDRTRDGVVVGEGSSILILEELESARARGAPMFQLDAMRALTARSGDAVRITASAAALEESLAAGRVCAVLGVEGAQALEDRPERVAELAARGVRFMSLTHLGNNALGGTSSPLQGDRPLSPLGREIADAMGAAGLSIDLAHASPRTFAELVAHPRARPFCSHTGVRGAHRSWRNLDDAQLRAIADRGGVVGIIFATIYLGGRTLDDVVRHVEHALDAAGEDAVAFGSDFDGMVPLPRGMRDVTDVPKLVDRLARRRPARVVEKVAFGNWRRFFAETLG